MARNLQQRAPSNPIGYRLGALAAAQQGDREAALAEVQKGLEAAPEDPDLLALQKLLTPKVEDADPEAFKARTEALLAGLTHLQGLPGAGARPEAPVPALQASVGPFVARAGAPARIPELRDPSAAARQPSLREGMTKMGLGDFRAAEARFSQRIAEKPEDGTAWRLRAMARRQLGDPRAAHRDASEALRLNPKDGWAWKTRALALADLKRYDQALADVARALALDPRDADAYVARAGIWRDLGRTEDRLADLKRAAELDAEFGALYRQALAEKSIPGAPAARGRHLRTGLLMGVALMGLGLIGYVLFRQQPSPPPADASAPPALRDFELLGALGQGGMGEVYEAMDRLLERRVAVKRLRPEIAGDPRERRRFLKEARTVAALKHPHIVEIYSVIERAHELFLVFELVKGETLAEMLARRGRLPLPEAAGLAAQMGAALDYAHSKSVIHQDLKPSNVMVADGAAKIMDFGIARRAAETLSTAGRAEVIGTPAYMAPEQEQGSPCPASDVFALGACVYEMTVGRRPFNGAGAGLLMAKLQEDFPTPSKLAPELPEAFDRLMRRALHPDPSRRIPAAGELAEELRRLTG